MSKNIKTDKERIKDIETREKNKEDARENIKEGQKRKMEENLKETKAMSKNTQMDKKIEKMSETTESSKKMSKMSGERTENKKENDEDDEGEIIKESEGTEEVNKATEAKKYEGDKEDKDEQDEGEKIKESEGTEEVNKDTESEEDEGDDEAKDDKLDEASTSHHYIVTPFAPIQYSPMKAEGSEQNKDKKDDIDDKIPDKTLTTIWSYLRMKEDDSEEEEETDLEKEQFQGYMFQLLKILKTKSKKLNENKEGKTAEEIVSEEEEMEPTIRDDNWMRALIFLQEMEKIVFVKKRIDKTYEEKYNDCFRLMQNYADEYHKRKKSNQEEDESDENIEESNEVEKVEENEEAVKETEQMSNKADKIMEKVSGKIEADEKMKKMNKDTEDKEHKNNEVDDVYKNHQGGKNIEAIRETIDKKMEEICEKQNKKIGEISEKQNRMEEQNKEMNDKLSKIMSILENTSKQEASTTKCDKDFKGKEEKADKKTKEIIKDAEDKKNKESEERPKKIYNFLDSYFKSMEVDLEEAAEIIGCQPWELTADKKKKTDKKTKQIIKDAEDKKNEESEECPKKIHNFLDSYFNSMEVDLEEAAEIIGCQPWELTAGKKEKADKKTKQIIKVAEDKKNEESEERPKKICNFLDSYFKSMEVDLEGASEIIGCQPEKITQTITAGKRTETMKKNIEAPKEIENKSENIELEKKINEITKTCKTMLEMITDTKDKKDDKTDKRIEEINRNAETIKKLFFLDNFKKSIEMYKEDKTFQDYYSKLSTFLESERENIEKESSTAGKMKINTNEALIVEKDTNAQLNKINNMLEELTKKFKTL